MNLLQIQNLRVAVAGRVLFSNLSFCIESGEKVMLSGKSGCGKSTLLRCILGLTTPESGVIRIFGRELNTATVWDLRRHLAYVAQEPDLGNGAVSAVLERPLRYKINSALRGNMDRIPALMARFQLSETLLDQPVRTLAGGEKQRIALVSAIMLERPIILLDEPSAALDTENRQAVIAYFREAADATVLCVSHDREWQAFCGRSLHMDAISGYGADRVER